MNRKYFTNIVGDLQLTIEYIFIEYERPILFLCKEELSEDKYLCLCYECRRVQKWIIAKVDEDIIYKMVYGENSVRQTFLGGKEWILVEYDGTEEKSRKVSAKELLSKTEILPDEDVNLDEDERDEYLNFLADKYGKSIQRISCDSMEILEGLSKEKRKFLKEQLKYNASNLSSIFEISIEFSTPPKSSLLDNLVFEDVVFERMDTVYNNITDNITNILEIDDAFNSAA